MVSHDSGRVQILMSTSSYPLTEHMHILRDTRKRNRLVDASNNEQKTKCVVIGSLLSIKRIRGDLSSFLPHYISLL